jgi:hypothetical protein
MLNWKTGRASARTTSPRCSRPAASSCRRTGRTRTPRPARVQRSVRRSHPLLYVTSVAPRQGHAALLHRPDGGIALRHWRTAAARRRPPCVVLRPCRDCASPWRARSANRLVLAIKAFPPFSHVSTQAAAVRHRCRPGELPASCVHDAVRVRLALLHTPIEPACARVVLAEPSARRSPSSRGRRRITIAELAPPPVLQTRGPI